MTRTRALAGAVVAGALAAAAVVMPAHGHDPRGYATTAITFTSTQGPHDEHFLDLGAEGPSAGDRVALASTLRRGGKVAGRLTGDCVWADATFEILQCGIVLNLPGGRVTLQGAYANKRIPKVGGTREVYAVTGGTGAYEGASGSMRRASGGEHDSLVLTLRR